MLVPLPKADPGRGSIISEELRLFTSLFVREARSALIASKVRGAAGAVAVRKLPGLSRGWGGVDPASERVASMEPLEPRGLCLREGDLAIFDRKPTAPPPVPPDAVELIDPSRGERMASVILGDWAT